MLLLALAQRLKEAAAAAAGPCSPADLPLQAGMQQQHRPLSTDSALRQLHGLRDLSISYFGEGLLAFPVQCLPTSLETLDCTCLDVVTLPDEMPCSSAAAAGITSASLSAVEAVMDEHV